MGGGLRPGDVVADRFEIVRRAGQGGMGVVYEARDRALGRTVALKVLDRAKANPERFLREAVALADLRHPAVVEYVAHGATPAGICYLAMEWLRGEDLSERLERSPLSIADTIALGRRIAEALAAAHAQGIVHRDVKAGNVFLPDGAPDQAKLLDFGVARFLARESELTVENARVGTPAYMSPEQARGVRNVEPASDVFSLGVVLYVCLTGKRPFAAEDAMAIIARILLADPQPIRELRPDCPGALAALIMRMLEKDAMDRPADGAEVAAELDRALAADARRRPTGEMAVGVGEHRLVTLVLAPDLCRHSRWPELQVLAEERGARVLPMADGTAAIVFAGAGAATDLAQRAARCVLALRGLAPTARFALVTGRAPAASALPIGEVIDRAVSLLRGKRTREPDSSPTRTGGTNSRTTPPFPTLQTQIETPAKRHAPIAGRIAIDPTTAGLLDPRFDVRGDTGGLELRGENIDADELRTVLGKTTPLVAREAELGALVAAWDACVAEPGARAALITSAPGLGKSRLRHELVARVGEKASVLVGRGDVTAAGAAFGVIASAIRDAAHVLDGEPANVQRDKLVARAARHLGDDAAPRVAAFLGEIVSVRFPDDDVAVRAARFDPALMAEQLRRAWLDFVRAECAAGPVVIVAEDLHWADPLSIAYLDLALRDLHDQPLFVVATARPEVHERFPRLFAERALSEVRLKELGERAAEKLVRAVLAERADDKTVAKIVATAGGHAFYLEELCRAVAEGAGAATPDTVIAMVQSRLSLLDPGARRVLYAASVFGDAFWAGGVAALLGATTSRRDVDHWLGDLAARELIVRASITRFPGEDELRFRHGIVREAAYQLMTADDRVLGHRLAGRWLERVGDRDPVRLAEHYEKGGAPDRAGEWHVRATEKARAGQDIEGVLRHVARAVACGITAEALGTVRWYEADALFWRGDMSGSEEAARAALRWLPYGDDRWFSALSELASASAMLGRVDELRALTTEVIDKPIVSPRDAMARAMLAAELFLMAQLDLAQPIMAAVDALDPAWIATDPLVAARCDWARSLRAQFQGDLGVALAFDRSALGHMERAGALLDATSRRTALGYTLLSIGDLAAAASTLQHALADAQRLGSHDTVAVVRHNLGLVYAYQGQLDRALIEEEAAVAAFVGSGSRRMEAASLEYLAIIHLMRNDLRNAEDCARRSLTVSSAEPPLLTGMASSGAVLARALLALGRCDEALDHAQRAYQILVDIGGTDDGDAMIRLARAEALHACGDRDGARTAALEAKTRLEARALRIGDPALRHLFLTALPEHARTFALADDVTRS
ncbi:MAG TPA: protein kinase [Kofleriaceae bacterium]|nr:protein kinase [Kofleriaceae bacterium]